jgi:hypothetical protein
MKWHAFSIGVAGVLLAAGCQWGKKPTISGIVNVSPALLGKLEQPNTVLLVVARNPGGVPVAVHQIISPKFPCPFALAAEDLILPDGWDGPLTITAQMATHARTDGLPVPELEGTYPRAVQAGDASVRIFVAAPRGPSWASAGKAPAKPSTVQ